MTVVMSYVAIAMKSLTSQLEHLIQLVASLPPGNVQKSMTTSFISTLWDNLLHPPLSYLGSDLQYRSADGSNNVDTILWVKNNHRTSCIQTLEKRVLRMQRVSWLFIRDLRHHPMQELFLMVRQHALSEIMCSAIDSQGVQASSVQNQQPVLQSRHLGYPRYNTQSCIN